jgi:beta-galactosidase
MGALQSVHADSPRTRVRIDADWRFREDATGLDYVVPGPKIPGWRWKPIDWDQAVTLASTGPIDTSGGDWSDATPGEDVFHGRVGFAIYTARLDSLVTGAAPKSLYFKQIDDNGTIFLNGKPVGKHQGYSESFDIDISGDWRAAGPNVLTVIVENTGGPGSIGEVVLAAERAIAPAPAVSATNSPDWRTVHLPHDFVVENAFDPNGDADHGSLPHGAAWYRKTVEIPRSDKGKRVWLEFDGVYRDCVVWVNGIEVARHYDGYAGFTADIGSAANYGGANNIAVHVDASEDEGWFYEGGGIYRHVWLCAANPVSIAQYGVFVTAAVQGLQEGGTPSAVLTIKTTLTNTTGEDAAAKIVSSVSRPDGTIVARVASAVRAAARSDSDLVQTVREPRAQLWSIETPRLYLLHTTVLRNGKPIDSMETPFGVRSIRFDANKGFFLNEKPVKIDGTCNHQDFAGIGSAMPDGILAWRIAKLKEMGSNAYRTSHNEVASELLDACDRQGMIVMNETRHYSDNDADLADLRQQVMRDRNHPCVIMWSIGNEQGNHGTADGARIGRSMRATIEALDSSRPVTEAVNRDFEQGSTASLDAIGINYNYDYYDKHRALNPTLPMFASETGSNTSTRGVYTNDSFVIHGDTWPNHGDEANGWVSSYDSGMEYWKQIVDRPFVAGGFVWTGFDYRGEPTPFRGYPNISSQFGIMDTCGFPKDKYYYYKAAWDDKPLVHILPHWNWAGKEGLPIEVWAFSNADRVELFLNGVSLGAKDMPKYGHLSWMVPYAPGSLTAKAMTDGRVVATDEVDTTGQAVGIRLKTDRPVLIADGEDESPVAVEIVDAQGRVVPTADNPVEFAVTGAGSIAGVGNGNPSCVEPDHASRRSAFNGLCMAIVRAGDSPGSIHLIATSEGLAPARIDIDVRSSGGADAGN